MIAKNGEEIKQHLSPPAPQTRSVAAMPSTGRRPTARQAMDLLYGAPCLVVGFDSLLDM
ncbi:MAG TPA: hypothetical protein VN207_00075 [Ktedonobacteraceae bacterium]|nr:hypothetical protein [Ktedonobacteraceae bacterium]